MAENRIEKLTPEQEARIPIVRDEWLAKGLATGPCNRLEVKKGVQMIYESCNLKVPELFIWQDSPLAGALTANVLTVTTGKVDKQKIITDVKSQVAEGIKNEEWHKLRENVHYAAFGQHDSEFVAWVTFLREVGVKFSDDQNKWIDGMVLMAEGGWWWPFDEGVVLTDRPSELHRDDQNRLHNEKGMSISYADGWGLYAVHGVRVQANIIEHPEQITSQQVMNEQNAEVRRVMCEMMGWPKFIEEAKLKLVDTCDDPGNIDRLTGKPQKLALYETPQRVLGTAVRVLLCTNATPERDGTIRSYGLTVPVETRTALEAAAWTFNCPVDEYKELARAT